MNSTATDLEILRGSTILEKLSDPDLDRLVDALEQFVVPVDTVVLHEGEQSDGMFFVLSGNAAIQRGAVELGQLAPGDHFGELGLLGLRPRAASVRATSALRLGRLTSSSWQRLSTEHAHLALALLQGVIGILGDKLVHATDSVGLLLGQRSLPRRLTVIATVQAPDAEVGERVQVAPGTLVGTLLPAHVGGSVVVAAELDRRPVSLDSPITSDAVVRPLTIDSWQGRDVVRRSAGLAFLEVARAQEPGLRFRLGGTIGAFQDVVIEGGNPSESEVLELAHALGRALARFVGRNVLFREEWWATEEAVAQLHEQGWDDGAQALRLAREATVGLVSCGELYAIRTGPFVRSTAALGEIQVIARGTRLFLKFDAVNGHGDESDRLLERELAAPRFGSEMTRAGRRWLARLGVRDVGSLDERCILGEVSKVIRPAESFQEKRIARMADTITERRRQVRVICVAGPSSSGKTTFLRRLSVQLEVDGVVPVGLSLDDYYVDREQTPRDEKGELDFEALEALQLSRLQGDVAALLAGREITLPRYDFPTGKSFAAGGPKLALGPDMVLVVEGIHALNPQLLADAAPSDAQFRVFVHPATVLSLDRLNPVSPVDVRLLRRIVRDRHGRSFDAAMTIARWPSVRRGEQNHIYPHLPNADEVFDTFLAYEVSVLKVYAERYLLEVPRQHPSYATAYRLRHLIDRFVAIHPDHVPPTSLLREFIGGSGFEY